MSDQTPPQPRTQPRPEAIGYKCKHRNIRFTTAEVERKLGIGSRCYNGSLTGDFCNDHGRLCDVLAAYQAALAQSSAKTTIRLPLEQATRDSMPTHIFMQQCYNTRQLVR